MSLVARIHIVAIWGREASIICCREGVVVRRHDVWDWRGCGRGRENSRCPLGMAHGVHLVEAGFLAEVCEGAGVIMTEGSFDLVVAVQQERGGTLERRSVRRTVGDWGRRRRSGQ